jgi:predicted ATPase/class 3 adenylate cyclase
MATQAEPGPAPSVRPTGTVTFLFSDIEGSTARWDRDRAAMQDAVRRHDALMRAAIAAHDGYVFKTIGDAFCAAFARPEDAVSAILDAQRTLAAEDFSTIDGLRVRAAVHTGTADDREGDYFGPAVNRVARLLAIGHGGQVLVSGACTELVQSDLPPRASLRDLGEHLLKDLARPERVFQLLAPDLIAEFPPLRSLQVLPNNLPLQLSTFVGRETEVADITALVEQHRLVTLTGSGGVGKTRTSLQVAANMLDGSGDGVWFIELAPLTSGNYIPSTVALALGLTLAPEGDPVENLVRALKGTHALLVFDNCEHLVEPAARVISAILHGAPKVKVLASSRQGLGVAGEETFRLPSLDVPAESEMADLRAEQAARSTAVTLFVERARSADKRFSLSDENAATIADICRRLDGIPLAIELAASRVMLLSPRQLRDRLDERFRTLTGGSRDVLPRHQTLRALIDWSYNLLDPREQSLFRRLSVFVSGFTLEGAIAVGVSSEFDDIGVFDVIGSLVNKSLVLTEPGDAVAYRLLQSTRAYGAEKLAAAGERETTASRHLHYVTDRVATLEEGLKDNFFYRVAHGHPAASELDEVRAALDFALSQSNIREGAKLLAAFSTSWADLGLHGEGIARTESFRAQLLKTDTVLHEQLASVLSGLFFIVGYSEQAREMALERVAYARTLGDADTLANAFCDAALCALYTGRGEEAERFLLEANGLPTLSTIARILLRRLRAWLDRLGGDIASSLREWESVRSDGRKLGEDWLVNDSGLHIAEAEHARGNTQRAVEVAREILPFFRTQRNKFQLAGVLANLSGYLAALDDAEGSAEAGRDAISQLARNHPDSGWVAQAIEHLALARAVAGNIHEAAILEGYADAALRRLNNARETTESITYDRLNAILREALEAAVLLEHFEKGAALAPESAVAIALGSNRA